LYKANFAWAGTTDNERFFLFILNESQIQIEQNVSFYYDG